MATPFESSIDDVSVAIQQRSGKINLQAFNLKKKSYLNDVIFKFRSLVKFYIEIEWFLKMSRRDKATFSPYSFLKHFKISKKYMYLLRNKGFRLNLRIPNQGFSFNLTKK